jgi:cytochrome c553
MRTRRLTAGGIAALAMLVAASLKFTHAQTAPRQPDAKRGADIVAQGTSLGAPACESCHGVHGNPDGSGTFPRLFRLSHYYLVKQLTDYKSGVRISDIMVPVAQMLSADDIADVAAFYAGTNAPLPSFPAADAALIAAGQELAIVGNAEKAVPGCNNCHGPGGAGEPPAIPYLAGQFGPYMVAELQLWQRGIRKNDGGAQMSGLAKRLDEHDIAAVASYYQHITSAVAETPAQPAK